MAQTPASLPPANAPTSAFTALLKVARNGDAAARREIHGAHPEIWRITRPALEPLESLAASRPSGSLKLGSSSTVLRVTLDNAQPAILKHYLPTKRLDPRDLLGRSKAMRSLLAAEALLRRGFDVARPLGTWSVRGQGSYLLLEDLSQYSPMHLAVVQVTGKRRASMLAACADLFRRMHRAGIAYRDLKPSNLLVRLPGTQIEDYRFVDHDRNRFLNSEVPKAIAMRDIAAFHAGLPPEVRATERWRALLLYNPELRQRKNWQHYLPSVLQEAAERDHRWIPRRLLAGPTNSTCGKVKTG